MPLCCFPCCRDCYEYCCDNCCSCETDNDTSQFKDIEKIVVDFMKEVNGYKPPRCKNIEYEIQWDQLHITSEMVKFEILPHNKTIAKISENLGQLSIDREKDITAKGKNRKPDNGDQGGRNQSGVVDNALSGSDTTKKDSGSVSDMGAGDDKNKDKTLADADPIVVIKSDIPVDNEEKCELPSSSARDAGDDDGEDPTSTSTRPERLELLPTSAKTSSIEDGQSTTNKSESVESKPKRTWRAKLKSILAFGKHTPIDEKDVTKTKTDETKLDVRKQKPDESKSKLENVKGDIYSQPLCLFKTEYTNKSGTKQSFTFQTDKTTTSDVQVTVQKSYKIGGKIALGFKIPVVKTKDIQPLDATGELTGEIQWSESNTTSVSKSMHWSVNNAVNVCNNTKVTAELNIVEDEASALFQVKYKITPIDVERTNDIQIYLIPKSEMKKSPEKRKIITSWPIPKRGPNGFAAAFEYYNNKRKCNEFLVKKNTVRFFVEGVSKCVYQSKQVIQVKTDTLSESERVKDIEKNQDDKQV